MKTKQLKLLTILIITILSSYQVFAQKKVALVWGNATYGEGIWEELPACKNDARVMDSILHSIGFETELLVDGKKDDMTQSLKKFAKKAEEADIVIIYYSGHGVFVDHEYYLIPAKTNFDDDYLVSEFFPERDILSKTNKRKMRVFFYDACRDQLNDIGNGKGSTPNISRPKNIGNNNIQDSLPKGLIWYCAAPNGSRTPAGNGTLSPFTQVLSKYISFAGNFNDIWVDGITAEYSNAVVTGAYSKRLELNPNGKRLEKPIESTLVNDDEKTKHNNDVRIRIKSNVSNAEITVNGARIEINEIFVYKIGKTYTYTVTAEGYKTQRGSFTVTTITPNDLYIELEKAEPAFVIIKSNTSADIYWDGKHIGRTPLTYKTTMGTHYISLKAKGYYGYSSNIDVNQQVIERHIDLHKELSWFWDYDNDEVLSVGYSYSPKYQIGLNYLYQVKKSRFSIGAYAALSTGFFHDEGFLSINYSDQHSTITLSQHGRTVSQQITTHFESVDYNTYIDPYDEATHYDDNYLVLLNGGYSLFNGLTIETGIGAAAHWDKVYLPHIYTKRTITTTDLTTGNVVGEPTTDIVCLDDDAWITSNDKWSLAMRIGLRTFIPLIEDMFITFGGGYTYLFSNKEYSSWDTHIGIAVTW